MDIFLPEFDFFGSSFSGGGGGTGESNVGANLGTGREVYAGKVGVVLNFRTLKSNSTPLTISQSSDELTFEVDTGLDVSYDGNSGSGSGRIITADSGPVEIDATSGSFPLRLVPLSSLSAASSGGLAVKDNHLFLYDDARSKWLSLAPFTLAFGRNGANQGSQYLRMINGTPSSITGYRLPWDCTLVAIGVQTRYSAYARFYIRRNSSNQTMHTFLLDHLAGDHESDTNVDFSEGDFVKIYMRVLSGRVHYPQVVLYFCRRGT